MEAVCCPTTTKKQEQGGLEKRAVSKLSPVKELWRTWSGFRVSFWLLQSL